MVLFNIKRSFVNIAWGFKASGELVQYPALERSVAPSGLEEPGWTFSPRDFEPGRGLTKGIIFLSLSYL